MISKAEQAASRAWFARLRFGVVESVREGIHPAKVACILCTDFSFEPSAAFSFVEALTRGIQAAS